MTRLLVSGTDEVRLPVDSTGKRAGFVKSAIGSAGSEIYLPTTALVDDAGNTLDSATAVPAIAGSERGLVVRVAGGSATVKAASGTVAATDQQLAVGLHPNSNPVKLWDGSNAVSIGASTAGGGMSVRGAQLTGQTLSVVAATPVTGTGLAVADAGNCTFIIKSTIPGTPYSGTALIVWEQSDDNVSWGPLQVTRADNGFTGSVHSFVAGLANGSIMLDAALEGVNWVRTRVVTAPTTNGMTIVTQPGGMPFSPSVSLMQQPWSVLKVLAAATTNASFVKASWGQVGGWHIYNAAATARYVRLYNKATAPTVGTDSPLIVIPIPAGAAANVEIGMGLNFNVGIGHAITAGIADLDATACAASDVLLNYFWR